jgi:YodL-like protein
MPTHFRLLLNCERGAQGFLDGYKEGNAMFNVYQGIVSDKLDGDEPEHVANWVFETFNVNHPVDYRNRSMSVGDVVVITNHIGEASCSETAWACESLGWRQVSIPKTQEQKLYVYKVRDGYDGYIKVVAVKPTFGLTPDVIEHLLHGRGYNEVQLLTGCEQVKVMTADELIPEHMKAKK